VTLGCFRTQSTNNDFDVREIAEATIEIPEVSNIPDMSEIPEVSEIPDGQENQEEFNQVCKANSSLIEIRLFVLKCFVCHPT